MVGENVQVPLSDFVESIVIKTAKLVLAEHEAACRVRMLAEANTLAVAANTKILDDHSGLILNLRLRWATLIGLMVGSAGLGGTIGGLLASRI